MDLYIKIFPILIKDFPLHIYYHLKRRVTEANPAASDTPIKMIGLFGFMKS